MNGLLTCARYAFAPNYYAYCGPDANKKIKTYLDEGFSDPKLSSYLQEFRVLYPYLVHIARSNGIHDPFDPRVVHAYWIGNNLLEHIDQRGFVDHLLYGQRLKDRISKKALKWLIEEIPSGARLHHSFHVFSIFTRTGHHSAPYTVNTMDNCRIGWGQIHTTRSAKASTFKVKSQKLVYKDGKLQFIHNVQRDVRLPSGNMFVKQIKPGDWITYHWGFICDKVTKNDVRMLDHYTRHHLALANQTI